MTLVEAMADWLRDAFPDQGGFYSMPRSKVIELVECHYQGGFDQFVADSPDVK